MSCFEGVKNWLFTRYSSCEKRFEQFLYRMEYKFYEAMLRMHLRFGKVSNSSDIDDNLGFNYDEFIIYGGSLRRKESFEEREIFV